MVVTISLGGFVADQMRYYFESGQYLWKIYYKMIIINEYILVFFIYIFDSMDIYLRPRVLCHLITTIKNIRTTDVGMYREVLFNISILCWNIFFFLLDCDNNLYYLFMVC